MPEGFDLCRFPDGALIAEVVRGGFVCLFTSILAALHGALRFSFDDVLLLKVFSHLWAVEVILLFRSELLSLSKPGIAALLADATELVNDLRLSPESIHDILFLCANVSMNFSM